MPELSQTLLLLDRCPHCRIDQPHLPHVWQTETTAFNKLEKRYWRFYKCQRCGGMIMANNRSGWENPIQQMWPQAAVVDGQLPKRAADFLKQAIDSAHVAPSGSIVLAASSIDAMLKEKKYTEGKLYHRIKKAAADHLITEGMADWAHEVRLEANEERHADDKTEMPTPEEAQRCIEFAAALGHFLFTLPARIQQGINEAKATAHPPAAKS